MEISDTCLAHLSSIPPPPNRSPKDHLVLDDIVANTVLIKDLLTTFSPQVSNIHVTSFDPSKHKQTV